MFCTIAENKRLATAAHVARQNSFGSNAPADLVQHTYPVLNPQPPYSRRRFVTYNASALEICLLTYLILALTIGGVYRVSYLVVRA